MLILDLNRKERDLVNTFIKEEEKMVFEKDMLFATLETSVRKIKLKTKEELLVADTVGFVSNLPHNLVKAFRSTLEEACEADLLLHIIDRSNPEYQMQIEVTEQTLREIGADHIPVLYVYNKIDQCEEFNDVSQESENQVFVSAKTGLGMEQFIEKMRSKVMSDHSRLHLRIPYQKGELIAKVRGTTHVVSEQYRDDYIEYEIECNTQMLSILKPYVVVS